MKLPDSTCPAAATALGESNRFAAPLHTFQFANTLSQICLQYSTASHSKRPQPQARKQARNPHLPRHSQRDLPQEWFWSAPTPLETTRATTRYHMHPTLHNTPSVLQTCPHQTFIPRKLMRVRRELCGARPIHLAVLSHSLFRLSAPHLHAFRVQPPSSRSTARVTSSMHKSCLPSTWCARHVLNVSNVAALNTILSAVETSHEVGWPPCQMTGSDQLRAPV